MNNHLSREDKAFLQQYDVKMYERPSVTVDTLLFTIAREQQENYRKLPEMKLEVLLVKRNKSPYKGQWALPGSFVGINESLEEAAYRDLQEETGIDDVYLEQLYTWGDVDRDPRTRIISTSYMALVDRYKTTLKAANPETVSWFTVNLELQKEQKVMKENGFVKDQTYKLTLTNESLHLSANLLMVHVKTGKKSLTKMKLESSDGIAFDHAKIIAYGMDRLRNKIEYTDIAFTLMPDRFTFTELQRVYETILNKKLVKANFRRKISHMVRETDEYAEAAGHRPSKLYTFINDWEEM